MACVRDTCVDSGLALGALAATVVKFAPSCPALPQYRVSWLETQLVEDKLTLWVLQDSGLGFDGSHAYLLLCHVVHVVTIMYASSSSSDLL